MKTFKCNCPGNPTLFFESNLCNACGRVVGIDEDYVQVKPFEFNPTNGNFYVAEQSDVFYKKCKNFQDYNVCNGMVNVNPDASSVIGSDYCFACRFNHMIPNLNVSEHIPLWQKMENAKRRALYTLKVLGLPLASRQENPASGLVFNFGVDGDAKDHFVSALPNQGKVLTGHDCGNITINLAEADDVALSRTRLEMGERYRTLLGHFRHELGHYYFDQLIANDSAKSAACKQVFGDHDLSYEDALARHYESGAPANWSDEFISEYATMHPWEDWAETWAHYMHIIDTLDTAANYNIQLGLAKKNLAKENQTLASADEKSFNRVLETWMEFAVILNSLNRSMGLQDAYPFVLSAPVRDKLTFIHNTIHNL